MGPYKFSNHRVKCAKRKWASLLRDCIMGDSGSICRLSNEAHLQNFTQYMVKGLMLNGPVDALCAEYIHTCSPIDWHITSRRGKPMYLNLPALIAAFSRDRFSRVGRATKGGISGSKVLSEEVFTQSFYNRGQLKAYLAERGITVLT